MLLCYLAGAFHEYERDITLGIFSALFGGQAKSRNYFNAANEHWREQQDAAVKLHENSQLRACLGVIENCQLALDANRSNGDCYLLLANALMVCGGVSKITPEAKSTFYSLASSAIKEWEFQHGRHDFITKNLSTADQIRSLVHSAVKRDGGSPIGRFAMIDATSPDSFTEIRELSRMIVADAREPDPVPVSESPPDISPAADGEDHEQESVTSEKQFCGWLTATFYQLFNEDDSVSVERTLNLLSLATTMGLQIASQDLERARTILWTEELPEVFGESRSNLSVNEWPARASYKRISQDYFFKQITGVTQALAEESKDDSPESWLFKKNTSRLGGVLRAGLSSTPTEAFFTMIFESIWDAIAYWVTFEPNMSAVEITKSVEEMYQPNDGFEEIMDTLMTEFDRA
jgi:hypothetical protein